MALARVCGSRELAALLVVVGCATSPSTRDAAAPGHQFLRLEAVTWIDSPQDFPGQVSPIRFEKLVGVRCTARNAKGTWEVATPGRLEVAIGDGAGNLRIDCALEGYANEQAEFRCITPRERAALQGALAGLKVVAAMGPASVAVAPVVIIGAILAAPVAGATVGAIGAGPGPEVCNYADHEDVVVTMRRR